MQQLAVLKVKEVKLAILFCPILELVRAFESLVESKLSSMYTC